MIDSQSVQAWVRAYERVWRTAGTDRVADLFTTDATYRMAPFKEPHRGLDAIRRLWDAERDGPDEEFNMTFDLVAVDDPVAVVRVEVLYGPPKREHWRDLWILEFAPDGRCRSFEEWPFTPEEAPPRSMANRDRTTARPRRRAAGAHRRTGRDGRRGDGHVITERV